MANWFMSLPTAAKVAVVVGLVILIPLFAVFLSPLLAAGAAVMFAISLPALLIRALQRGPLRGWVIVGVASLVLLILFGGIGNALYGSPDKAGKEATVPQSTVQEASAEKTTTPKGPARTTTATTSSRDKTDKFSTLFQKQYTNPRTPEETVLSSIEKERNMPPDKAQDIRVSVDADQNGCRHIQLNYQTRGATSIESEMEEFYKAIYGDRRYSQTVCEVTITAYGTLTDRYGQNSLEEVYQTTLGKDPASRINWQNSDQVNFPSIWTVNYVEPSTQAAIEQANAEHALDCVQHNGLFDRIFDALQCP